MSRILAFAPSFLAAALVAAAPLALAQPAPAPSASETISTSPAVPPPTPPAPIKPLIAQPVEMAPLAAPDAFTTPARDTGLPPTLWRGTSLQIVQAVLPRLAERPLSPAAAALALRVLGTGAQGPDGAGQDFVAARAAALLEQGDPRGAAAILARAPGLDRDPALAHVAAESALLAADDARACRIEETLSSGRDDIYWVRLRAYCQAVAGKAAEAQLSFDLSQSQAKDPIFTRLMTAKLAGGGQPGAASLRNGLDYALSRGLGLDLSAAKPAPAVAAALAASGPAEPTFDTSAIAADLAPIATAIHDRTDISYADFMGLLNAATPKTRQRTQAALLFDAVLQPSFPPAAAFLLNGVPPGRTSVALDVALDEASGAKRMGETALLALWECADAGPSGLSVGDRIRIVRALRRAGLDADARAFALEGLLALK
ncbi:MAG: hypothetical protein E7812_00560 [Phenylobacterium sp.]|nr:MAG: hypothetical protein E7812_00560 [Phenylobacterium sp.]